MVELRNSITNFKPKTIGISIRNIDNTSYPDTIFYLPKIKKIIGYIKSITDVKIIIGGSGFSIMPYEILNYLDIDIGVVGSGEKTICEVLNCIEYNEDCEGITGVVNKKNCQIRFDFSNANKLLNMYMPNRDSIDYKRYCIEGSVFNLQTERGCAFNCIYCTYPKIEGSRIFLRDPDLIVEELELIQKKYGGEYFCFTDSVFNYPINHAYRICEKIIKNKLKIKWSAYINPKFLNEDIVKLFKKSGCRNIEIGIDSASDKIIESLGKNFGKNDIVKSIALSNKYMLKSGASILLGGPGEGKDTIEETFNLLKSIYPSVIIVSFGIRIYPGTVIYEKAKKEGYDLDNLLKPRFYISEKIDSDTIKIINNFRNEKNVIYESDSVKLTSNVIRRIRRLGVKGSLWEAKNIINK